MSQNLLLGIDSGNSVTKAVIFSTQGDEIAISEMEVPRVQSVPRFVERDMLATWEATCDVIRAVILKAKVAPEAISCVSVTGHGDGLYIVDKDGNPLGKGITSLDTRAAGVIEAWEADGTFERAMELTGQHPYVASPSAILKWIKQNEITRYRDIGWVLSCKDWIRYKLTGVIATDWTEASTSFVAPSTQKYSEEALALYDLSEISSALPQAYDPCEIIGEVLPSAAKKTGLAAKTPVATGLHDVTASAIGMGCIAPGQLAVIAGTYSINEVISSEPMPNAKWFCRSSFRKNQWMNMAISPASSANIDWFVKRCCQDAINLAEANGGTPYDYLESELETAFSDDSSVVYHPFLYGSPHGNDATAAFLGLQGWHERGHFLKAVIEGVVFNHRYHLEDLKTAFDINSARLSGGSSRSSRVCQLFSDVLGLEIQTVDVRETGAQGAAICGGVAAGLFKNVDDAVDKMVSVRTTFSPDSDKQRALNEKYEVYCRCVNNVSQTWAATRGQATDQKNK